MTRPRPILALFIVLAAIVNSLLIAPLPTPRASAAPPVFFHPVQAPASETRFSVYLPLLLAPPPALIPGVPWRSPFGVQVNSSLAAGSALSRTVELNSAWVRLGDRISWLALQRTEGAPIQWDRLAGFEQELRALKQSGVTPVVIINYFPRWATIQPTSCGAIRPDKLAAFAQFVGALVARYQATEFNVHYWELGNEPDVDPSQVGRDNAWGCWGDIRDPYYGGRRYGEMLKVVGPAIKAADPQAQVWVGGLLLARPDTNDPKLGRPELFLQGILEAGAAPYFDVVPYHVYSDYDGRPIDYDITDAWVWKSWGGRVLGKARFLKQLMALYGVDKPLVLNEIGLLWCPSSQGCPPPGPFFNEAQANFIVRSLVRGIGGGIQSFAWYPLEAPGFRYSALLDSAGNPKPVYYAYQQLALQLKDSTYVQPVEYGAGVEAYAFRRGDEQIHVIWTIEDTPTAILIPQASFVRVTDRVGTPIAPEVDGTNVRLMAGFSPIYVVRRP